MSTLQKQRWLIKFYFVINHLKGHLVSLPFVPKAIRLKLSANIKVNPFEGFNWSLFDLLFYSGDANGQHITDILNLSERLNICFYSRYAEIISAKRVWHNGEMSSSCSGPITTNNTLFRVSFEEGEVLRSLPKASTNENLYCFINVFSELSEHDCLTILKNAKQAVGQFSATVVVIDAIQLEGIPNKYHAMNDMQLLLGKNTKQRTLTQWQDLINNSDFILTEIVEIRSSNKVLVLKPAKS